jgi:hypothetical protein
VLHVVDSKNVAHGLDFVGLVVFCHTD